MAHDHHLPTLDDATECVTALVQMFFGDAEKDVKEIIAHVWTVIGYGIRMVTQWKDPIIGSGGTMAVDFGKLSEDEAHAITQLVGDAQLEDVPKSGPLAAWIIKAAIVKAVGELWEMARYLVEHMREENAVKNCVKECDCDCCRTLLEQFENITSACTKLEPTA